jgi:hypothetical protein
MPAPLKPKEISMNRSTTLSKLAAFALVSGLAAVTATSAQAARNGVFSSYDPTFAYTGDPAYAHSRAEVRREPAQQRIERHVAPSIGASKSQNLPYADRPYGDPDVP